MRIGIIAFAALVALGAVAFDGFAESVGVDGVFTQDAAASCIEDGVTGRCWNVCPPGLPDGWACPL